MRLRGIGEFGLIARVERAARRAGGAAGGGVVLGIGDDAAVLRLRAGEDVAVTTDALVEDVHFRWATEPAEALGRRAMAAALSDLAAVGARPLGVVVALAAPPGLAVARIDGLVRGVLAAARRHAAPLVGGNLSRAPITVVTLACVGALRRGGALTRGAARPGDRVLVTGALGASALDVARAARGRRRRHVPEPRLAAGRALASLRGIGACIDVSDGLAADLAHVLEASGVGADLDPARVPRPPGFGHACARLGLDPLRLALAGGEDYELLFTLRPAGPPESELRRRLGLPVTEIGRISARPGLRGLPRGAKGGWRHF
jgi:thiamine-monophosphate kinase